MAEVAAAPCHCRPQSILLLFLLLSSCSGIPMKLVEAHKKTWCVAKPSTDEKLLLENLHYACSNADCSALQPVTGRCFLPDSALSHASVAINLYYQKMGRNSWNCNFNNSGLIVLTDPSYGHCIFP